MGSRKQAAFDVDIKCKVLAGYIDEVLQAAVIRPGTTS